MARVLVVDDDEVCVDLARSTLVREGFDVVAATSGAAALRAARQGFDLIVLDWLLPDTDGLNVCREIRQYSNTPILMLSARNQDVHRIVGLEVGADDYLCKPFNPLELAARVRALLRRSRMTPTQSLDVLNRGRVRMDIGGQKVSIDGQELSLTPLEFRLLRELMSAAGMVLSRQELLDRAWGESFSAGERTVDVHVRNLRAKMQAVAPEQSFLISVRSVGYKFDA